MEASAAASAVWRLSDAIHEGRRGFASIEGFGSMVQIKSATIHSDNLVNLVDVHDREILIGPERLNWIVTQPLHDLTMEMPENGSGTMAEYFNQGAPS